MVPFWNLWIPHKAFVPGLNHLQLLSAFPTSGFIFSNLFIPICGVLPFLSLDVFLLIDVTRGKPIMARFLTVAFILTIFCDEKYLK